MNRKRIAALAGLLVLALLVVGGFWWRSRGDAAAVRPSAKPDVATPAAPKAAPAAPAGPGQVRVSVDDDPAGPLRLEGQVLGADDEPVGGAKVWLSSVPPRSATSEADGSFSFDKLVGRTYRLNARAGDRLGGPVSYKLTATSEPVAIRLRQGASLTVIVTGEDQRPIKGAAVTVTVSDLGEDEATTDAQGKAVLRGLDGWIELHVAAAGFGPVHTVADVPPGGREVRITLRRGALVAGKVVDERGQPIAKAKIGARDAAQPWLDFNLLRDGLVSNDQGEFEVPGLASGTYRLVARHDDFAPAASAPITLDGVTATRGVTITMKAGAVLAGTVVTADRQPAPFATVRVGPQQGGTPGGGDGEMRQTTADERGAFTLKGLPRAALRARAESETAASKLVDVDLSTAAARRDLVLVLDVTGTIAGLVVDGAGEPVPEAQVTAMPDILGGADPAHMALSGFSAVTTDGGGRFAIHGLPEGDYRLWAQRSGGGTQQWTQQGTAAKTGDREVRIVLPAPGSITGTVAFEEDGKAPDTATVQIGWMPGVAAKAGAFELRDLPPGTYDLHVRGPTFAEAVKRDVEVAAGKATDVGAIKVKRGRRISGSVLDDGGSPVPGAKVAIGKILISDGSSLGGGLGGIPEERLGIRSTLTGADGTFTLVGVPVAGGTLVADQAERGRSWPVTVPPGKEDASLSLTLRPFGSLEGVVSYDGKPLADAQVQAWQTGGAHVVSVKSGADGAFVFDRLPAGKHRIIVQQSLGMLGPFVTATSEVTIAERQRSRTQVDFPIGPIDLTVQAVGKAGAQVDGAQIFLARGTVNIRNGRQLLDLHAGGGTEAMGFRFGTSYPTFHKVRAGAVSICTIPLTGNMQDPSFMQRLNEHGDELDVYCMQKTLSASPAQQTIVHEVPAMKPIAELDKQ